MSIKLKRILSAIVVLCLTVSILAVMTSVTENKNSIHKYKQFFEQEADFDVLFLGSSKVINGVQPMDLWEDYGIVSYNMGGHANTLPTTYWVLRNALDYTTPRCVVIDCYGYGFSNLISSNFYYAHLSFDAFPLSVNKILAVCDLIDPSVDENVRARRMELLWNFSIYHSRWSNLEQNDFSPSFTYQKGAEPRINVSMPAEMATVSENAKMEKETRGHEYLIKMITLCQERGINVLLMHTPYPAGAEDIIAANAVYDVAEKYDVQYLNFLNMDVVDYQTDMQDPDSHLNPLGARKITAYLGEVLRDMYQIPDRRNDEIYRFWEADAEKCAAEKLGMLADETSEKNLWMLLTDTDYSFVAEIRGNGWEKDQQMQKLMSYAGIQIDRVTDHCCVVVDRFADSVQYIDYEALLEDPVDTTLGVLSLRRIGQTACVLLDEKTLWESSSSEPQPPALTAMVFDYKKSMETLVRSDS